MKMEIAKADVWAASIKDKPGALNEKLDALAQGGVNLEFVIARRSPEKKGAGVVFVTPIKGAKGISAAKKAKFKKTASLHDVRVTMTDKPGLGAKLSGAIAEAGVNLRGFSGVALGRKAIFHLAFDKAAEASKAVRVLKKL